MGLLSTGSSLTWEEIKEWAEYVKEHGVIQFINVYNQLKGRGNDLLKYGDEIEYTMIYFDHQNKSVRLDLRASEALDKLQEGERNDEKYIDSLWRMEYASYMIEGTPGKPFCCTIARLKLIETSMWLRKQQLNEILEQIDPNLTSICYTAFPRIGCYNFTEPIVDLAKSENLISKSCYFPDEAIFGDHPRFGNLTRNIRSRMGHKQKIYVPVWFDTDTPNPFVEKIPVHADEEAQKSIIPNHIYMDCMGFGMGCSCLQITIQAGNLMESRFLYDQLAAIAPIVMALSAGSPCWKGILSDWDCRWKIISMGCDDRMEVERDASSDKHMRKSRYDTIDMYIHPDHVEYNDVNVNHSTQYYNMLVDAGIDEVLAKHISHLFSRDPISLFKEKLEIDDNEEVDHFENLQSTNWQSCRFKPPPFNSTVGWRVEFRTLEVQFTCYENSLFVIFIILLSRAIIKSSLNFIVPISLMEENMDRAILRDAVNRCKFHFRNNFKANKNYTNGSVSNEYVEITADEIFNGKVNGFYGLIPLIREYVSKLEVDKDTLNCIEESLRFIGDRASGKIMTPASWMREYIKNHPKYQHDSFVTDEILYDMTCKIKDISDGKTPCPSLYGSSRINKIPPSYIEAYKKMIQIESMTNTEKKLGLLERTKKEPKPTIILTSRWKVFESLYMHYMFYTNPSMCYRNLGEMFQ